MNIFKSSQDHFNLQLGLRLTGMESLEDNQMCNRTPVLKGLDWSLKFNNDNSSDNTKLAPNEQFVTCIDEVRVGTYFCPWDTQGQLNVSYVPSLGINSEGDTEENNTQETSVLYRGKQN